MYEWTLEKLDRLRIVDQVFKRQFLKQEKKVCISCMGDWNVDRTEEREREREWRREENDREEARERETGRKKKKNAITTAEYVLLF